MDNSEPSTLSRLFRANGERDRLRAGQVVLEGQLRELIARVISDNEPWRYSIVTPGRPLITEPQIRALAQEWGIRPT